MKRVKTNNYNKKVLATLIMAFFIAVTAVFLLIPLKILERNELDVVKASTGFKTESMLTSTSNTLKNGIVYKVTTNFDVDWRIDMDENSVAVIYVAPNCTLNAKSGITIPSNSALILVGDGKVIATGESASAGGDGREGAAGSAYQDTDTPDWSFLNGGHSPGYGPQGWWARCIGSGGAGGKGASSGIGGVGGWGGNGGLSNEDGGFLSGIEKSGEAKGGAGANGEDGTNGGTMGSLYILGNLTVQATGGSGNSTNGSGGQTGAQDNYQTSYKSGGFLGIGAKTYYVQHTAGGQGGGGAGGGGGVASNIGGGGGGGGGGGAGASGCSKHSDNTTSAPNCNGAVGAGGVNAHTGAVAPSGVGSWGSLSASGGSGGRAGSKGGNGTLYIQNYTTCSGRARNAATNGQLSELQYDITFDNKGGTGLSTKSVYLGQSIGSYYNPTRAGYTFCGYYTGENGTGTRYFDGSGNYHSLAGALNGKWDTVGDVKLYAYWTQNLYQVDVNIMSTSGVQDYASGTMSYYNSYTGNRYTLKTDQPEDFLTYNSTIQIYDIAPKTGTYVSRVYLTDTSRGSLTQSGSTYTYKQSYGGSPKGGWDNEIMIQMATEKYGIEYNWNGGTSNSSDTEINYGNSLTFPVPTRTGYTYLGFTSEDEEWKKTYTSPIKTCSSFPDIGNNGKKIRFVAQWKNNEYYIKYDGNGTTADPVTSGSMSNTTFKYYDTYEGKQTQKLSENKFKRDGFTFLGWSKTKRVEGDTNAETIDFADKAAIDNLTSVNGKTITLYAVWKRNTYTITFDPNGGSGTTASLPMLYNNGEKSLPKCGFTKTGYLFKGWMKNKNDANNVNIKDVDLKDCAKVSSKITAGYTLYAKWEATWAADTSSSLGCLNPNDKQNSPGSDKNPYLITSAKDLAYLSKEVQNNSTFENKYFEQTAPIDLTGKIWMPIGGNNIDKAFGGCYNGNGFAIIGLQTYDQTDANGNSMFSGVGLFGRTNGATLTNLYLTNANIIGKNNVGGLVGENYGKPLTLEGCFVRGNVSGLSNVGGLVGNDNVLTLRISNSGFAGDINGGAIIVGQSKASQIKNCYAEVVSNVSFCGDNAEITACVYSAGGYKRYFNDIAKGDNYFADWTIYNGKPLPKGLTWIGGVSGENVQKVTAQWLNDNWK